MYHCLNVPGLNESGSERPKTRKAHTRKAHTRKAQNNIVIKCIEGMYYDDLMQCYFYIIIYISIYCISVS